jgi:tetratricopeptide (TPR) repeat protein
LERFTQTTFVGEPTGERANFYGDPTTITAPNSKLKVSASTLWWQDQDPRDTRPYIAPQLAADLSFADYKAGRDPAMEAILNYKPEEPLTDVIRREVQGRHPELALQAAKRYLANPLYRYQNLERPINLLGYEFVGVKDLDRAIEVFKLNTELYPTAFNTWDSLAEAYADRGERDAAIKYYEKSLALNPASASGQAALTRLRAAGNVSK